MRKISFLLVFVMLLGMILPVSAAETTADPLWTAFENPPDDSKTRPLWFWNREVADMTTEQVREIVRESYLQSGYNGFGILPDWQSAYLTDEYFELYEAALDEGSKYGMHFALYDENGFPSYNAGGLLEEQYPELTTKRLDKFEQDAVGGERVILTLPQGKFMGAVAMNMDTMERVDISEYATIREIPEFDADTAPVGATASSTYAIEAGYEAAQAVDGDLTTRWNAGSLSGGGEYLQINFGKEQTFDTVKLFEDANPVLHRAKKYIVRYWDSETEKWEKLVNGTTITDAGVVHTFEPVTSQAVRLVIQSVTEDSATISEFQIFSGETQLEVPPTPDEPDEPGYAASSVYEKASGYEADKAFDGDRNTRWNAGATANAPQWLEISFGAVETVDSVKLWEHIGRITAYDILCWQNGQWKVCASGTTIGENGVTLSFDPVTTTKMRLNITASAQSPTIWEFQAFNGTEQVKPTFSTGEEESPLLPEKDSYLDYTVPAGNWKVMAFMCVVDGNNGMDYLDPASVRAFIDITYEEYYKRFQRFFEDGTISMAFYDEPTFWPWPGVTPYGAEGARMWTPSYNEAYAETFDGESPVLNYPALWYDIGEDTDEARNKLQYVRTEMFAENYLGQINTWCNDHGISLTGHMLLEEWVNPVGLHGDLMKCFKDQDIPGVDVIGHFGYTQEAYKIVSSSANNWDKQLVMTESFGAMGANMNPNVLYKSSMDQYAKGVNLMIPHAVWYDTNGAAIKYPPELSYRNDRFKDVLPVYNTYMGRLNTLLQGGRHVADIAMLYPIDYLESSFIFNGDANNPADADYMTVGETLSLRARRDFTYLHPDILDQRVTVDGNVLNLNNEVNHEQFQVMVIPGMKVISLSNLQKIKTFYDNGGKVIATTQLPDRATETADNAEVDRLIREIFGVGADATADAQNSNTNGGQAYFIKSGVTNKLEGILDAVLPVYDVEIARQPAISGGNFSYIHRVMDGREIYFFANSSDTAFDTVVNLRGELEPMIWNPHTGTRSEAAYTHVEENGQVYTSVNLHLGGVESLFVVAESESDVVELSITGDAAAEIRDETVSYTVSAENMKDLATVLLKIDMDDEYLAEVTAEAAEGWYMIFQQYKDGVLSVALGNNEGANGDGDLLTVTGKPTGKTGAYTVAITEARMAAFEGEGEINVEAALGEAFETEMQENRFDVNRDGVVNQLDMTRCQRYYGTNFTDADVNRDGDVDIDDLILILNHFNNNFS